MKAVNSINLVGNIGGDAKKFEFKNGNSVLEFSLAVDNSYKDKSGERIQRTNWIPCKLFLPKSATAQHLQRVLTKGSCISTSGELIQDSYEKSDSTKVTTYYVNVDEFAFVGGKG